MKTAYGEKQRHTITFAEQGRTKQAHKAECDINNIMAKYIRTGTVEHGRLHGGNYGFATSQTFHEAMNVITQAEQMFGDLPARVRAVFNNSPAEFLKFCEQPDQAARLAEIAAAEAEPPPRVEPPAPAEPARAPEPPAEPGAPTPSPS